MVLNYDVDLQPSIDQIPLKQMGIYKALNDNDDELFQALK